MLKKIFSKKGKSGKPGDISPATKAPIVDEDETIVINLTGTEKPPTEDISLKPAAQSEANAPEPEPEVRLAVLEEPKLRLYTETAVESTPAPAMFLARLIAMGTVPVVPTQPSPPFPTRQFSSSRGAGSDG